MSATPFGLPRTDLDQVVTQVPDLKAMLSARWLITGGTGFVGKWIVGSLLHAAACFGAKPAVTVITRDEAAMRRQWPDAFGDRVALVQADLSIPLQERFAADFLIHAAAETGSRVDPAEVGRQIVLGADHLFSALASSPRVLFLSSGAVYDELGLERPLAECDCLPGELPADASTYGRAKRVVESKLVASGVDVCIARLFAFVGPFLPTDAHFAIGNFLGSCARGDRIVVRSRGGAIRSYMYPSDLVVWLLRLLRETGRGAVCNVGSDEGISIADLATRVAGVCRSAEPPLIEGVAPDGPRPVYLPDIAEARRLGLSLDVGIDDAITRTWNWMKARNRSAAA